MRLSIVCLGVALMSTSCALNPLAGRSGLIEASPEKVESFSRAALTEKLALFPEGQWIAKEAGTRPCGVDVWHYEYKTVGGGGESTTASAALMVPTGEAAVCNGPFAIVGALHGTVTDQNYNLADFSGTNQASPRAIAFAATFAAEGYVVVAPNYAGYDTSPLPYHPYINAEQQSADVIDALEAARQLLKDENVPTTDKLFLTGFSQGGYVTVATQRALQKAGTPITASFPSAGAYPINRIVDEIFLGQPLQFSTMYFPLSVRSYQEAYGDLFEAPGELFNPLYAEKVLSVLPTRETFPALIASGQLPATALFGPARESYGAAIPSAVAAQLKSGSPANGPATFRKYFAEAFGDNALFTDEYRAKYIEDALKYPDGAEPPLRSDNGLRRAVIRNDLRGWIPETPMVICGGSDDPAVPFRFSSDVMARYWTEGKMKAAPGIVTLLDFESPAAPGDAYADLRAKFAAERADRVAQGGEAGVIEAYHMQFLPKYCYTAARQYFDTLK